MFFQQQKKYCPRCLFYNVVWRLLLLRDFWFLFFFYKPVSTNLQILPQDKHGHDKHAWELALCWDRVPTQTDGHIGLIWTSKIHFQWSQRWQKADSMVCVRAHTQKKHPLSFMCYRGVWEHIWRASESCESLYLLSLWGTSKNSSKIYHDLKVFE